jgi:mannitol 2-dehydrogenase
VVELLFAPDDPQAVVDRLVDERTRIVSLTITEGGYDLDTADVAADVAGGSPPRTVFRYVVEALQRRRLAGVPPFTVLSCDNVQHNGVVARAAFAGYADLVDAELGEWIRSQVAFPSSMVDRITPATTDADRSLVLDRWGVADAAPVVAEPFAQWVLEDRFCCGRPELERVGAQLVDDVTPYEALKLRLLNGGHQAIAYAAALRGHRDVAEAVADPVVARLLEAYLSEAVPTLPPVPGIDVAGYLASLRERFANRAIGDTVDRLCAFASDRIPAFVLPVVRDRLAQGLPVVASAAVVACWAHYRRGLDEAGRPLRPVDNRPLPAGAELLRHRAAVGDLADDPRFLDAARKALERLERGGVRALIG